MEVIEAMIEELASSAMGADAADLPSVVQLHSQLAKLQDQMNIPGTGGTAANAAMQGSTEKAMILVEKIVMAEVEDVAGELQHVREMVAQMQQWIAGAPVTPAAAAASPAVQRGVGGESKAILDEHEIKADDVGLVREFVVEARGHMDAAEAKLLAMEEEQDDPENINAVFRAFHTIKGVAGFLELRQIGALAHTAENLLDRARKGIASLNPVSVDLVLNSVDVMRRMLEAVEKASGSCGTPPVQEGLEALLAQFNEMLGLAPPKGTPPTAPVAPVAAPIAAPVAAPIAAPVAEAPAAAAVAPAAAVERVEPKEVIEAPTQAVAKKATGQAENTTAEVFVKVSTDRLDSLVNTVGELVIAQAMVSQDVSLLTGSAAGAARGQRLTRNMSHLGKITRSLQDLSMSMRMVPIQNVFQKMARLARDVARKNGKEIDFIQIGGETELDRNVVEAVSDPLVHMVRNAIDHGVETPEQRAAAGKPRAGRVQLKAFHLAGNVVIEIKDDGRGLNKARILAKAVTCGIIKEGQILSDDETFRLVFHPGLSTAEKITDISGRGVGMDVARKNVEALRGRIDIASEQGKGSLFTIRLPLTLAVIDGLVVKVGNQRYIVPITSIDQSLRPTSAQLSTIQGKGEMCMIRDLLLPLVRLSKLFGVPDARTDATQAIVVIVRSDQGACCLLVDELLGQQQVVIKSLGERFKQARGISGGAILGDGNVSLILDVPGLVTLAREV